MKRRSGTTVRPVPIEEAGEQSSLSRRRRTRVLLVGMVVSALFALGLIVGNQASLSSGDWGRSPGARASGPLTGSGEQRNGRQQGNTSETTRTAVEVDGSGAIAELPRLRIVEAASHIPVAGARVVLMGNGDAEPERELVTDAEGVLAWKPEFKSDQTVFGVVDCRYYAERLRPRYQRGEWQLAVRPARSLRGIVRNVSPSLAADYRLRVRIDYRQDCKDSFLRNLVSGAACSGAPLEGASRFELRRILDVGAWVVVEAEARVGGVVRPLARVRAEREVQYVEIDLDGIVRPRPNCRLQLRLLFEGLVPYGTYWMTLLSSSKDVVAGVRQQKGVRHEAERVVSRAWDSIPAGSYYIELRFDRQGTVFFGPYDVDAVTDVEIGIGSWARCVVTVRGAPRVDLLKDPVIVVFQYRDGRLAGTAYVESVASPVARMEGLPPGTYLVHARAATQRLRSETIAVTMSEGETRMLDFDLKEAVEAKLLYDLQLGAKTTVTVMGEFGAVDSVVQLIPGRSSASLFLFPGRYSLHCEPGVRADPLDFTISAANRQIRLN